MERNRKIEFSDLDLRIARIDPSRGGGIIETRAKLWDFRKKNKYSILVKQTQENVKNLNLPERHLFIPEVWKNSAGRMPSPWLKNWVPEPADLSAVKLII